MSLSIKLLAVATTLAFCTTGSDIDSLRCGASEADVEASEELLVAAERTELLQRGVRHLKAGSIAASSIGPEDQFETIDEHDAKADEVLMLHLKRQKQVEGVAVARPTAKHVHQGGMANQTASPEAPSSGPVDCNAYPMFCDKKVNCAEQPLTAADRTALNSRLATNDGRANPRAWCLAYPMYATSVQKCIVSGDPAGYAHAMYESQTKMKLTGADAIYCFVAGHCNNTEASDHANVEEAEAMCDRLYTRSRWTSVGWTDFLDVMNKALELGKNHRLPKEWQDKVTSWGSLVKLARHEAQISAMTACAMGNFQCDLAYCRINYCNNPTYRAHYGNLSWEYPDS